MSNTDITPDKLERRSFLYRKFDKSKVTWSIINNYATVSSIIDLDKETNCAKHLALSDLSYLQRIGFKGEGACEWLEKQNIQIPISANDSLQDTNGCLIARLGINDMLILDNIKRETNVPNTLEKLWHQDYSQSNKPCGFIMPRQESHTCFSISGNHAPEMFAKLCAIDLRTEKFNNKRVTQTSLARLGATIIRNDLNTLINYLVLVESASAEYCWDCLLDAMQEFKGQIIGTSALSVLAS